MTTHNELKAFLEQQHLFVLAVAKEDGSPWATPLAIKKWQGRQIEWKSSVETLHSRSLALEPRVSCCLFMKEGGKQIGFYASGKARMIEDMGDGYAQYAMTIEQAWLNDEDFVKRELESEFIETIGR